jgi:hypothetical protein
LQTFDQINIAVCPPESPCFQTNRGTIELRSGRKLKEIASLSQGSGLDLDIWIQKWQAGISG